jgi:hypothetical protein
VKSLVMTATVSVSASIEQPGKWFEVIEDETRSVGVSCLWLVSESQVFCRTKDVIQLPFVGLKALIGGHLQSTDICGCCDIFQPTLKAS